MANTRQQYVPERRDIIWINFRPSVDEEIRGRHPAVVLSTSIYSELTGLVLVTPITHAANNRLRDFFIAIDNLGKIQGYINPLQFYTFSVRGREIEFAGEVLDDDIFAIVKSRVQQIVN